jgi:hypothetical protein
MRVAVDAHAIGFSLKERRKFLESRNERSNRLKNHPDTIGSEILPWGLF